MFLNIVVAFFFVNFIVFIHELGHFFSAKSFGIKVKKFSIGFGQEIVGFTKNETRYSISAFLFGGFVKMEGDNIWEENPGEKGEFLSLEPWEKILIAISGPLMNIIFAILVIFVLSFYIGIRDFDKNNLEIGGLLSGTPAVSQILPGDKILRINQKSISDWDELTNAVNQNKNEELQIDIERQNENLTIFLRPIFDKNTSKFILGITPKLTLKKLNFSQSLNFSLKTASRISKSFFGIFTKIFTKGKNIELIGPVGVIRELSNAVNNSTWHFMFLLAILSLNLGFINILPLPILDGGYILLFLCELFTKRKFNKKFLEIIFTLMFVILLGLTLLISYRDILKFFK